MLWVWSQQASDHSLSQLLNIGGDKTSILSQNMMFFQHWPKVCIYSGDYVGFFKGNIFVFMFPSYSPGKDLNRWAK